MHDESCLLAPSAQDCRSRAHFPGACPVMKPRQVFWLGLCLIHLCAKLLRKPVAREEKFPELIHVGRQPLSFEHPSFSCLEIKGPPKRFVCLGNDLRSCTSTMPLNNTTILSLSCNMLRRVIQLIVEKLWLSKPLGKTQHKGLRSLSKSSASQDDVHEVPNM